MTICVFLGPTLAAAEARKTLDALYLPPAGHGDLYRATLMRPKPSIIALVDGNFRHRPAVRHKEILWAMAQGIHVFGAASIGALRAAELAPFGMVGIGRIFADYRDGRLEDDDEVAVDHGPAELGYLPVNEAMVDIRASLSAARQRGVIGARCEELLIARAKRAFYPQRNYAGLLEALPEAAMADELAKLSDWLPTGKISQKRDDALALLGHLRDFAAGDPPALVAAFHFERTEAWDADVAFATPLAADGSAGVSRTDLLDELRLDPGAAQRLFGEALGLALARREAARSRVTPSPLELEAFRRSWLDHRNLRQPDGVAAWCRENQIDEAAFGDFIAARAREARLRTIAADLIEDCAADALRVRGDYVWLAARAGEKQRILAQAGVGEVRLGDSCHTADELLHWFCRERLGRPVPVDVEAFAIEHSFPSAESLYRVLLRERLYLELTDPIVASQ